MSVFSSGVCGVQVAVSIWDQWEVFYWQKLSHLMLKSGQHPLDVCRPSGLQIAVRAFGSVDRCDTDISPAYFIRPLHRMRDSEPPSAHSRALWVTPSFKQQCQDWSNVLVHSPVQPQHPPQWGDLLLLGAVSIPHFRIAESVVSTTPNCLL